MATAVSSTPERRSEPNRLFGEEIVGFKWVYTFNTGKLKLIPENHLQEETHGFEKT
jgi:hypothetical protein